MSKILLLDKLFSSLREWIETHHKISEDIENNILQKDNSNIFEEKIVSIGLSSLLVYIGTAIAGLFGIATGGFLVALVLFPIGWIISRLINKKLFGSERKIEDISDDEQSLLKKLQNIDQEYKTMGLQIRFKKILVGFTEYGKYKRKLKYIANELMLYDASKLAIKYRVKHKLITKKYTKIANQFDAVYAKGKKYA